MEKLFVQIFERKNRIIEQVKQQTESYNQNLASRLLIEGITPPSWLWNPTGSSDSEELNKGELISKFLAPYTLASVHCSTEQYPLYNKPFISGANQEFSDGFLMETLDNCPNGQGSPTVSATRGDAVAGCSRNYAQLDLSITSPKDQATGGFLNISNALDQSVAKIEKFKSRQKDPELDFNVTSPKDQTTGGFLDIFNAPDQSVARIERSSSGQKAPELNFSITTPRDHTTGLFSNISSAPDLSVARIQRSKSRQKALELRNSANEVTETTVDRENISGILSSRIRFPISSAKQTGNEKELPELDEPCAFGSPFPEDLDLDAAVYQNKDSGMNLYSGRITRSRSRVKILSSGRTSIELGDSKSDRKDVSLHGANTSTMRSVCISSQEVADYRNRLLQSPRSSADFGQNDDGHIRFRAGSLHNEKSEVSSGKISSYKSSHRPQNCASGSQNADSFSNDDQRMVVTMMGFGDDLHEVHIDESPVRNIVYVRHVDTDDRGSILEDGYKESSDLSESVHCSEVPSCVGTVSRFSSRKKSVASDKVQTFSGCQTIPPWYGTHDLLDELGDFDFMMNKELVANKLINHSVSSNANGDEQMRVGLSSNGAKKRRQLESLVAKDSVYSLVSEEIKQLNFSEIEEQNSKTLSSTFGKKSPDTSPNNGLNHDLLLNNKISNHGYDPCLGGEPLEDSDQKNVSKVHTNSSYCGIQEHLDSCAEKYASLISENTTPKRPRDNIEGGDHQYSEVEDEADVMMSKMVDTPNLQSHLVEQCWEQGHETSAEQVIEEGIRSGEGSDKSREVSHATGSKDVGQSCHPKLDDNLGEESHGFSSGQMEMANPMCVALDKTEQLPAQESQILSHLTRGSEHADTPVEHNRLVTSYKSIEHGEDLLLESRFELGSIKSWPLLKRRKIEELQVSRLASYPSSVKHIGSIQRDSPSRYLRNIEMYVNTDLPDSLDRKMSVDVGMDQDKDTNCINTENLNHTTRMLQAEKFPLPVDGQQSHCLVRSPPKIEDLNAESMSVFERFSVETQVDRGDLDFAVDGVDLTGLSYSRIAIERASIIEEMCRSASLLTPMSDLSSALKFQGAINPLQSLPNGFLENLDLKISLPFNVNANKQLDSGKSFVNDMGGALERIERMPYSVSLPYSGAQYGWNSRIQHASPVGGLWERLSSQTGSSEKCSISNPELTCFPIEEDPCISEDNKRIDKIVDDVEEETDSLLAQNCNGRHPLRDLTNMGPNSYVSTFAQQDILRVDNEDAMSAKSNVGGPKDDERWSLKNQSRSDSVMSENPRTSLDSYQTLRIGYDGTKKANVSIDASVSRPILSSKTSLKKQEQNASLKDSKRNNIVSNIGSFIPLVQQTQAAAVCAGKRDIKVKALEAAEAAKRLEEKIMNERKNRKEALKLERAAKLEVENLRKMELEKKKKELERKKKDVDVIAKKRSREEEDRKEKEKKRMRFEARLRLREQEERGHAERAEKEKQHTKDEQINSKKSCDKFKKEQNHGVIKGDGVSSQKAVIEECGTTGDSFEAEKALPSVDRSPQNQDLIVRKIQETSYEISPYQCSDDEDEEDEELPTKKYIPSWASKNSVALLLPLQQKMEPDLIFHPESFCCMDEVLLPRKLQQRPRET